MNPYETSETYGLGWRGYRFAPLIDHNPSTPGPRGGTKRNKVRSKMAKNSRRINRKGK